MKRTPEETLVLLGRILYAVALAQAIDKAPFQFNPHALPYTHYLCIKCWQSGTRVACEHR